MEYFDGLTFKVFEEHDVDVFTDIMKRAFDDDIQRHLGEPSGGPPGYDNGDFLRKYALDKKSTAYAIFQEDMPLGVVIVWIQSHHEHFLGNIFIDPNLQGKGLGLAVWKFIEHQYPDTRIWRTETAGFSRRNHHFYVNKCGFHIVKIENPKDIYEASYIMEKDMRTSGLKS